MSKLPKVETMPLRACVESFINEVEGLNQVIELAERNMGATEADGVMLLQHLDTYGAHSDDCDYIEEASSGRILKDSEEELCSCGWTEVQQTVAVRLKKA